MAATPPPGAPARPDRITPMWLAHHYPEDYDRCLRVGRRHVCRRCAVLYPVAFVTLILTAGAHPPAAVDVVLVALLPLPALVEFVLEHLGVLRYSPVRLVALTLPLGVGLGRGLARYLDDHGDRLFWGVVILYTGVGVAAAFARQRRGAARTGDAADPSV
jgi:hypothetical protein